MAGSDTVRREKVRVPIDEYRHVNLQGRYRMSRTNLHDTGYCDNDEQDSQHERASICIRGKDGSETRTVTGQPDTPIRSPNVIRIREPLGYQKTVAIGTEDVGS